MITDSFLLVFGLFAAISAFMNLFAPQGTTYGLLTLTLGSLAGGVVLYLMYYYFYQYYDVSKRWNETSGSNQVTSHLNVSDDPWV